MSRFLRGPKAAVKGLNGSFALISMALAMCILAACASGPPVSAVTVSPSVISPNGDGKDDLARISYTVNTDAHVTLYLTDAAGKRYDVRSGDRPTSPKPYEYLFNGIGSDGHMLPNGVYTWHVEAQTASGATMSQQGPLTIQDADTVFPKIIEFTASANEFTPNRDGIDDHVYINVVTSKASRLHVYVIGANGFRYDVPPRQDSRRSAIDDQFEPGRYFFDYDGGIDLGADPPPDGQYQLVAESTDKIGQQDRLTKTLTIKDSGRPVAEIVTQPNGQGFEWSGVGETPEVTLKLGGTLYFTTTIRNTGNTPIRTAGPFDPTLCYTMHTSRYSIGPGYPEEPGVWRVGVNFETNTGEDHPWRWGVGTLAELTVVERDGFKLYYLPVGKQVQVRGCIVLDRIPPRNPFRIWGALIQEQVEIAQVNSNVSPILVTLVKP